MMEKNARPRGLRIAAALALALVCALGLTTLSPTRALAAGTVAHIYDGEGNKVEYTSIYSAMAAGYGKTVYLDADIEVKKAITIPGGKTATLDMMGHTIKNVASDTRTFALSVSSNLTITSSVTKEITFTGYDSNNEEKDVTVTTGGVISGAYGYYSGGAIYVSSKSTLTLKNVTVGGNRTYATSDDGGAAIAVNTLGTINLEDNTQITANYSSHTGGAIRSIGDNIDIVIKNSSITDNTSESGGGAIMVEGDSTDITMSKGASIEGNVGGASGGAVDFSGYDFSLTCSDGTATIAKNHARYGGAVYAVLTSGFSEGGTISGITFSENSAYYQGGAMFLRQNNVTVENCTITGGEALVEDGGGIYIRAKNDTVKNCTIQNNTCHREGGGIYVYYRYDLNVDGILVVDGNKREDGAVDDVFLDSTSANNIWAYLRGNLSEGSHVGFRTGVTGDRRVMKDLTNYIEGTVFMDMDSYHVSYGSSDNDLWQRQGEYDYLVTLNGKSVRRFARGATVTVDGSSSEDGTFFCRWDTDASTGISGISETDKYKELLTFTMPQNDVHLVGVYASPLTSAGLRYFRKPVAGEALPTFASFRWKNSTLSSDGEQQRDVPLTWYEVAADGTMTQASGVAKAGTTYVASFSIAADPTMARVFSTSMADDAVTVYATDGSQAKSASTSVDTTTGTLTVTTAPFTTEGDAPADDGGTITVKLVGTDLPVGASEQAMLLADAADDADEDLIGEVTVSYAEGSDSVTIAAPEEGGWNFCNWERTSSACSYDDELGKVVVNDLTQVSELTATYTPVVTEASVGLDAPVAGATLPSSVSELTATCSDGTTYDLVDEFSPATGTLPVSWSSEDESVTAQPSTTYTALIELANGEGITDVEKVMSPNAIVTANGTSVASTGFVVLDNTLYLCVTFPETQGAKLAEVVQPDDVELTFDEAKAYQAQQDAAAEGDLCWPLPKSCAIKLEGGQTIPCDVTWDVPTGFDASATAAQELTATGKLSLPSYIDGNDVSLEVTCTIKVAAPDGDHDKGDDEDDKGDDEHGKGDEDEKGDGDEDATKPDSKDGEKKSLPQTGDTNSISTVIVLIAAGAAVLVVAFILRNRKK